MSREIYQGIGEPITGILHSADASAGVAVPIFNLGSTTARTLTSDEYIEIHSVEVVAAASGDVHVFLAATSTPGNGRTAARGTTGTNGGIVRSREKTVGTNGDTIWVIAPAGACDVVLNGSVRKEGTGGKRPSYQASLTPGV